MINNDKVLKVARTGTSTLILIVTMMKIQDFFKGLFIEEG